MVAAASALLDRPLRTIRALGGGVHAVCVLVDDGATELVVRAYGTGDNAVTREVQVLPRVRSLGERVPQLVAYDDGPAMPLIITTRVGGDVPAPDLSPVRIAVEMGRTLAAIHQLDGRGLPPAPTAPPTGDRPVAILARGDWPLLDRSEPVLTHYDFWCGNLLWDHGWVTGVVDWSGARHAPRGVDLAWSRLDVVLLGDPSAADRLLDSYQEASGRTVDDIARWDRQAAALADPDVESWAPNYAGVDRGELTAATLRQRLDAWISHLLDDASGEGR